MNINTELIQSSWLHRNTSKFDKSNISNLLAYIFFNFNCSTCISVLLWLISSGLNFSSRINTAARFNCSRIYSYYKYDIHISLLLWWYNPIWARRAVVYRHLKSWAYAFLGGNSLVGDSLHHKFSLLMISKHWARFYHEIC